MSLSDQSAVYRAGGPVVSVQRMGVKQINCGMMCGDGIRNIQVHFRFISIGFQFSRHAANYQN